MLKLNYIVKGSVRGKISNHKKLHSAITSLLRDRKECASLGNGSYSDAEIFVSVNNNNNNYYIPVYPIGEECEIDLENLPRNIQVEINKE
jgi:hypothetical protein